ADGVNTYFVSKAARAAGLTVALSGLGGDELFAGYASFRTFRRTMAIMRAGEHVPAIARSAFSSLARAAIAPNRIRQLGALLGAGSRADQVYAVIRAMFTPDQCQELLKPSFAAVARGDLTIPEGLVEGALDGSIDPINAYSALELSNYMVTTLLRDSD